MTGNRPPAFQFYPRDFLTDEKQAVMTVAAAGAYIRLLCICWLEGSIPDDPRQLARLVGITQRGFMILWPQITSCFVSNGQPGRLVNLRIERERQKQAEYSADLSKAGKRGAKKRWGGHSQAIPEKWPGHAEANGQTMRLQFASSTAVCTPQPPVGGNGNTHSDSVVPEGAAAEAYQQWRKAWEASGRKALPLEPRRREADHCIAWVSRYPETDWRALQLRAFFESDNPKVRASPPSLGWFVTTWADEIDKALRDKGHRPASEAAA